MLEELGQKIANEQQEHRNAQILAGTGIRLLPDEDRSRHYLKKSYRQHEPRAEGQKVLQKTPVIVVKTRWKQDQTAQNVGCGGNDAKNDKLEKIGTHKRFSY